ncbi:MAG TPA: VCBS repeat-containing protein, partial [Luteimonas sp.]|nr:VCBS repeat-containing protein [Luteimonas sp.]
FDGDGKADVLWRNDQDGRNTIWRSANSATSMAVTGVSNLQWQVAAVGDYDGDGRSDILWRNNASGANVIWKSGNAATQQAVTAVTNLAWKVVPHEGQPLPPAGSP